MELTAQCPSVKYFINNFMKEVKKLCRANFEKEHSRELIAKFGYTLVSSWKKFAGKATACLYASHCGIVFKNVEGSIISVEIDNQPITKTSSMEQLMKTKQKRNKINKETFFYYHKLDQSSYWGTNEEMRKFAFNWRNQAINNDIKLIEENNKEFDIDGKTFYTMVIQPSSGKCRVDFLAVGVGFNVCGYVYWFTNKENRDAIFYYVVAEDYM